MAPRLSGSVANHQCTSGFSWMESTLIWPLNRPHAQRTYSSGSMVAACSWNQSQPVDLAGLTLKSRERRRGSPVYVALSSWTETVAFRTARVEYCLFFWTNGNGV